MQSGDTAVTPQRIGVPKEIFPGEKRVATVPDAVTKLIKLGFAVFAPFGKDLVELDNANGVLNLVFNVIWLLLFGWPIAVAHATSALILAITIIGIPFSIQHLKLIPLSLFPFGRDLQ